jgi:hypothetical protein
MLKYLAGLALMVACLPLWSQVPEYDYFPQSLCKEAGLRMVTVYETQINDPTHHSGPGNRIRLAKDKVRQVYFEREGWRGRSLELGREGEIVEQEVVYAYDATGLKLQENLRIFNTNNADSTKLIQDREQRYYYRGQQVQGQLSLLVSENERLRLDSVAYERDGTGKLQKETVYSLEFSPRFLMEKVYFYAPGKVEVVTKMNGEFGNRDVYELDEKGRKIHEINYARIDTLPLLETFYSYDPRGWLQEVRYEPSWRHHARSETVISRKNKFDDHGKLVESQFDYGDGKRRMEFYDHSYWVED